MAPGQLIYVHVHASNTWEDSSLKQPRILTLLCMVIFSFSLLNGQTSTTGSVAGVVSDSTSAIIPGAVVVLKSVTTDAKKAVKTSSSGSYRFDLVPPGNYTLTVDQTGFSKLETAITVTNAQVLGVDLKLSVGSQSQTINVEAAASTLQTENGNVATNVSQLQIAEVPNSGNNMTYVTKLTPGMGTGFGVSGSTIMYTVDGMRNNDPYNNANNSGPSNMMMGINDVQEATVTGNGYSGQFGGLVGAQVSYVTNSGSNRLHGNLAWFWTGRSLVANTWFGNHTGAPRPFENVNMWQGAISGPAIKDKLFFYADTEGLRAVLPSASTTVALPSANLEAYTLKTLAASGLNASIPFYQNMFNIYNAAGAAHNAQPGNSTYSGAARLTGCPTATTSLSAADLGA